MGTPIWMGQPSSVCKRVLERMDAFLEGDRRQGPYGVLRHCRYCLAVVGNEDVLISDVSAEVYQALNDVGFTIPANAVAYWVGEAMGSVRDFVDLEKIPDVVTKSVREMLARNTAHLAKLLKAQPYPGYQS